MENRLVVDEVLWHDSVDDLLAQILPNLLIRDVRGVLSRDNDGVNTERGELAVVVLVLDRHLGLSVWANPVKGAVLSDLGELVANPSGQQVGQGHALLGLIRCIAEHDALVSCSNVLWGSRAASAENALVNVRGLLLNSNNNICSLVVKALVLRVIANVLNCVAHYLLVVDRGLGGDLAKDHHHAGLGGSLASNLGVWVLGQASIEDGVRDLVRNLVSCLGKEWGKMKGGGNGASQN